MDLTELKRQKEDPDKRHPWELARARIIGFFINDLKGANHIADIGSGDAYVLQFLQKKHFAKKYTAIDIAYTEDIIASIGQHGAQNIHFENQIAAFNKNNSQAGIVLLTDVLEHC
nr:hypothetical protein [Chitinophagaceae bacterium]